MGNNKRVHGNERGFLLKIFLFRGQNHTLLQGSLIISQRNQELEFYDAPNWAKGKVGEL